MKYQLICTSYNQLNNYEATQYDPTEIIRRAISCSLKVLVVTIVRLLYYYVLQLELSFNLELI